MDVAQFLRSKFPEAEISFDGEDCNSRLLIVSNEFEGLNTLQRHKLVLNALKEQFQTLSLQNSCSWNFWSASQISLEF